MTSMIPDSGTDDARTDALARKLSALAAEIYADAGCPGAYVTLTDEGYELHEPSPNAFPTTFATAEECERAIRQFVGA